MPAWLAGWPSRTLTFFLVVLGWVLFRAADLPTAQHFFAAMFGVGHAPLAGTPVLLKLKTWYWLAGLLAFVWFLPNSAEMVEEYQPYPGILKSRGPGNALWWGWRMNRAWACFAALLLAVSVLSLSRAGEFLYYNF